MKLLAADREMEFPQGSDENKDTVSTGNGHNLQRKKRYWFLCLKETNIHICTALKYALFSTPILH